MSTVTHPALPAEHLTSQSSGGFARLFATSDALAPLVSRVALGAVMFPHGAQKALGWFGGAGFAGTMDFLTAKAGLPAPIAFLVVAIEFLGSLALLAGVATRVVALGFVAVMLGAILTVHAPNGFFMNWTGDQAGEGFEYHLLAIGIAVALLVSGGGRASIDRRIARS
jgi:putative oxidoreductase